MPMTRALLMMLLSHRTLGSHNSHDKSRQLFLTQAQFAANGHDSFDHNRVWCSCYSCGINKPPIDARDCSRNDVFLPQRSFPWGCRVKAALTQQGSSKYRQPFLPLFLTQLFVVWLSRPRTPNLALRICALSGHVSRQAKREV